MPRFASVAWSLAVIAATSCGRSDAPTPPANVPNAASLDQQGGITIQASGAVVSPSSATITVGGNVQLTGTFYNKNGKATSKPFTWSSSATAIAAVSSTGLVTGVATGSATITAVCCVSRDAPSGYSATSAITVTSGSPPPPPPASETLLGAGDIAVCSTTMDEATADILDANAGTIALLGDNAYPDGTDSDYTNCFGPSWGRHKARIKPALGNHEYGTPNAAGYFNYFGAAAGDPTRGYYSYDLGSWHIVVLNSSNSCTPIACYAGSPQETWLRADLAATTQPCILAYWHHPRFSSDLSHGNNTAVAPFWDALYQVKADIILNGHAHTYERFGLQNPSAVADANGIREFVVGTGGKTPLYSWGTTQPNSEVRNNGTWGVLKLTLGAGTYSWNFLPVAGQSWTDSGSGSCH